MRGTQGRAEPPPCEPSREKPLLPPSCPLCPAQPCQSSSPSPGAVLGPAAPAVTHGPRRDPAPPWEPGAAPCPGVPGAGALLCFPCPKPPVSHRKASSGLICRSLFIYSPLRWAWLTTLPQANVPWHLSPRKQTHVDQTLFIFSLVIQGCAYATVCGISHSSKQASSHVTLKLGCGGG